jgi:peptidoglycan/LPS O-acetylase OafA/YrhL
MKINYNKDMTEKQITSDKTEKLTGADGIRAIACLAVIMHHLSQRLAMQAQVSWAQKLQAFGLMGNTGVSIFFVLSGFLLSYPFWKRYLNNGRFPNIKQYALRRAARIMPGFYISLAVSTFVVILLNIPVKHLWMRFISGLTFTSGFNYVTFFPSDINGPFWSISFEVFSYLLMPIFMLILFTVFNKKRTFAKSFIYWLGVFILILLINQIFRKLYVPDEFERGWQFGNIGGANYWMPNYNIIGFFGHFSLGILAAGITSMLYLNHEKIMKFKRAYGFDIIGVLTLVGSFALLWLARYAPEFSYSIQSQPYFFPYYPMLIAISLSVMPHTNIAGRLLDNAFFKYTAKVSFGLYIWHYLIIYLVSYLMFKDYQYMGIYDWKIWLGISFGILVSAYIVASLSYNCIERPILNWSHKKK